MSAPLFSLESTPLRRGTTLIEASAGTGKTFTIAGLVVRLIVEKGLSIQEILVTTYTVPATAELRDRIRRRIREAFEVFTNNESDDPLLSTLLAANQECRPAICLRLDRALRNFDEAPVFSLHGFCHRMLGERAFESGLLFDAELVPDQHPILREVAEDFWRGQLYQDQPLTAALVLKNKITIDELLRMLVKLTQHPTIKTIPAQELSLTEIKTKLQSTFCEMQECWKRESSIIKRYFESGGNSWAKGTFRQGKPEKMVALLTSLGECLTSAQSLADSLECFEHFTSSVLASATKAKERAPVHRLFDLCEKFIQLEQTYVLNLKLEFLAWASAELPRRKAAENILSFDDLQTRLLTALRSPHGESLARTIRGRFKAALIDEFQDTDPIQYEIFSRIYVDGESFLFFIGDPKQAIYGFRGADIFTYMEAADRAELKFTLGTNWRSEQKLVEAVNRIFAAHERPFVYEKIGFTPVKAAGKADAEGFTINGERTSPLQLWVYEETEAISKSVATARLVDSVAAEIARLLTTECRLGDKALRPQDIAVLVASHYQATLIQEALHKFTVPNVLHSHDSVFHSHEAMELLRVLQSVADPTQEMLLRAALATDVIGYNALQIAALKDDVPAWEQCLLRFQRLHEEWSRRGFIQMFRHLLLELQVRSRLLAYPDGERRLTNLLHLSELLQQVSVDERLGIKSLIKWLAEQIAGTESAGEEEQLRLERDENSVRIVTMHKSKGLEYPVVFCPFTWESSSLRPGEIPTFHDEESRLTQDLGSDRLTENQAAAEREKLAEKLRLLYVALTRARNRCYFAVGRFAKSESSAPNYLLNTGELPDLAGTWRARAQELAKGAEDLIHVTDVPETTAPMFAPTTDANTALHERTFRGWMNRDWRICSFSSLTFGRENDPADFDHLNHEGGAESDAKGIFAFPRGTHAGTCLHSIFEQVDFQDASTTEKLIGETLRSFGYKSEEFEAALCDTVKTVVNMPLEGADGAFKFASVPHSKILRELEFHFPIDRILPHMLRDHFAKHGQGEIAERFPERLGKLTFSPVRGFMKGFIDVVFQQGERFYIVDWKSNWLGAHTSAYHRSAISAEMHRRYYFLQYHLYCVALHRFLGRRLAGYDFAKNFGGVFYIFVRGVTGESEFGVYSDVPSAEMIAGLSNLLGDGTK